MLDEGTLSWNARYELELDVIKRRHSPVSLSLPCPPMVGLVAQVGCCVAVALPVSAARTKSNIKTQHAFHEHTASCIEILCPYVPLPRSPPPPHAMYNYCQVCTEIMMKGYRCMKSELLEKVRPFEERSERERTPSALGLGARSWVIRSRYPALYGNQTYPQYAYERAQYS